MVLLLLQEVLEEVLLRERHLIQVRQVTLPQSVHLKVVLVVSTQLQVQQLIIREQVVVELQLQE